jgi:hypothetical protein
MATRPELFPEWATDGEAGNWPHDEVTMQPNVAVPPPWKRKKGWSLHEFTPRQWFNWLHRTTFDWLRYLDERRVVVADGNGVGLFPDENSLIILIAVNKTSPLENFLLAVGWKGEHPILNQVEGAGLSLGSGSGNDFSVTGAAAAQDIAIVGVSFPIPASA